MLPGMYSVADSEQQLLSTVTVAPRYTPDYLAYHGVLPLSLGDGVLKVASTGSPAIEVLEDLARTYQAEVLTVDVARDVLEAAIEQTFANASSISSIANEIVGDTAESRGRAEITDVRELVNQPPVIRFVNLLFREAQEARASDVHLEATRSGLRVRLRIDGVLSSMPSPPPALLGPIVSRIKLLAELDIAQTRQPQDGRIRLRTAHGEIDVRVSTVPTMHGESVVMRLLTVEAEPQALSELGMSTALRESLESLLRSSHGLVLATGPTGSGKTTTLHSGLALRASDREKLVSVEDPIEYLVEGVTQVPVLPGAGVTFATALRSILRQDPDVVMVGEMRDVETTSIAIQAALTGHLVLSTLHTNDAVSAVTRLLDLGVRPFLLAATLSGVLAQRLVRRLCFACRAQGAAHPLVRSHFIARGCSQCRGTGYSGRVGVYELLLLDETLKSAVATHAPESDLATLARRGGMVTMNEDCLEKVATGHTSLEEMARVLGPGLS